MTKTMTTHHPDHDPDQIQMQCSALAVEMSEARHHPSTGEEQDNSAQRVPARRRRMAGQSEAAGSIPSTVCSPGGRRVRPPYLEFLPFYRGPTVMGWR